jgi:hypothetical protein
MYEDKIEIRCSTDRETRETNESIKTERGNMFFDDTLDGTETLFQVFFGGFLNDEREPRALLFFSAFRRG